MESETDDTKLIDLDAITTEGSQTRASLRREAVVDYARLLRDGARFPPAVVYSDGAALHLACGHHRRAAYRAIGRTKMPCIVRQGTRWDAVEAGIRDNQQHLGERLTRQDKRHNIRLVLREHPDWSDRAVGDLVGASPTTAGKVRAELASECPIGQSTVRLGRDGRRIDTATVGRKQVDGPRATDAGPRVAVADDETAGAGRACRPARPHPRSSCWPRPWPLWPVAYGPPVVQQFVGLQVSPPACRPFPGKRRLPFSTWLARWLVRWAIRRSSAAAGA